MSLILIHSSSIGPFQMKEGLEFGRMATAEKRDAVKQKVLSEVSHDPSNPAHLCPSIANDVSRACPSISNGIAGTESSKVNAISSVKPAVGMQRQSSGRRVPDPDSTTNAEKGERDRNLYDAAVGGDELEDAMDCIGVEERSTQHFTGIKEPSKHGRQSYDLFPSVSIKNALCKYAINENKLGKISRIA